jgi:hypothetical protein
MNLSPRQAEERHRAVERAANPGDASQRKSVILAESHGPAGQFKLKIASIPPPKTWTCAGL